MTVTERPEWVTAAIEGRAGPMYDAAREPFDVAQLVAEATVETGYDNLGPDDWREPLEQLVRSVNEDGRLHIIGRWRLRETLLRLLRTRLRMVAAMADDQHIEAEHIRAPLIVTGSPRSGSSILHQLLAIDPALRAPLSWEFWMPVPTPVLGDLHDPRIAMADRDLRLSAQIAAQFDAIHEMSSLGTRECGAAMSFSFRSEDLDGTYPLPTYTSWLRRADWTPALQWHQRVLQLLQLNAPRRTWVLKNPAYLGCLDAVIATYPDAQLVITHRDPIGMISSLVSLYATLQGAYGRPDTQPELAADLIDRHASLLNGLVDWVEQHPAVPIHHVTYDEFVADPIDTVATISRAGGRDLSNTTRRELAAHLASHPQHRHGGHAHSLAALGLDEATTQERFARYIDYFGVGSG